MRYADRDAVLYQLNKLSDDTTDDAIDIALAESIEDAVALRLDEAMGRSFGVDPTAETRTLPGLDSRYLTLLTAAVSVTGIETGGTWDGAAWSDGTVWVSGDWRIWQQDNNGRIWALESLGLTFTGNVRVTAIWADQQTEAIPADLVDAATFITVDEFRMRKMSPAGQEGPDGLISRPRNPWNYRTVADVINKYRVPRLVI